MSTDRELLELAAKAAGYQIIGETKFVHFDAPHNLMINDGGTVRHPWNSLKDDGDALRLAVKLGFRIEARPDGQVYVWIGERLLWNAFAFHYTSARDLTQALRRAVTGAAAEIGRTLP